MKKYQYQSQQLSPLLESLRSQKVSGTGYLDVKLNPPFLTRSRVLVWRNGEIIYGGANIPNNYNLAKNLVQKFKPDIKETTIRFAQGKAKNPNSVRELLELLVRIRVLKWEQIETFIQTQTAIALEQILPHAGQLQLNPDVEFDLCYGQDCHGLDWTKLVLEVTRRQQEWNSVAPIISSMDAVPRLTKHSLRNVNKTTVRQHLKQWVDGKRSLVAIAEKLDKDPLQLARSYLKWAQMDWVKFSEDDTTQSADNKNLPTILSVDDSPIVQTTIKRALGDRYNLFLANNGVDALSLLNQKKIDLLLLDVTMPDIDGLEMCRTVRSIPKFRDLPIIMLTARDGYVDKLKGQIAGTNQYLTKPFDVQKLLGLISRYVGVGNT